MANGLIHYAAALVVSITLYVMWRDCYRFIARDTDRWAWWERPVTAVVAAFPPALVAAAAYVLGARL